MGTLGLSNYHQLLARVLRRRADEYLTLWGSESDKVEHPSWQFFVEDRMVLTLLVATYLEALANLFLSLNIHDTSAFQKAEREAFRDKWTTLPQSFIKGYTFPTEGPLVRDLDGLIERRKSIVHMKPELVVGGTPVHKGNPFLVSSDDHQLLLDWLSLPIRLIEHLQTQAGAEKIMQFRFLSGVDALRGIAHLSDDAA